MLPLYTLNYLNVYIGICVIALFYYLLNLRFNLHSNDIIKEDYHIFLSQVSLEEQEYTAMILIRRIIIFFSHKFLLKSKFFCWFAL